MLPLKNRKTAMPMTAAGYVAAIVIPARSPKYALAAPSTTAKIKPMSNARTVNSLMFVSDLTNGTNFLFSFISIMYNYFYQAAKVEIILGDKRQKIKIG
jgi:hypothetical protein